MTADGAGNTIYTTDRTEIKINIKQEGRIAKMNKNMKTKIVSILSLTMCMASVSAGASGVAAGNIRYSIDGKNVNAPMPGNLTTSVDMNGNGSARLVTAVYDSKSGTLKNVSLSDVHNLSGSSEEISNDVLIDTMDGYTLKHFIWDGEGKMLPADAAKESNINLVSAVSGYGKTTVTWKELYKLDNAASVSVEKNGSIIAENIAVDKAAYQMNSASGNGDIFRIIVKDAAGRIISSSNTVSAVVSETSLDKIYSFETDKLNIVLSEKENSYIDDRAYGSDDKQVVIGGGGTLHYDETAGKYVYDREIGDGNWGVTEIGGKKALFTTAFEPKNGGNAKKGCINVLIGDKFTTEDSIDLEFEYYDNGTDTFTIRYANGATTGNFGTINITKTGTDTWKTAKVKLNNAYFNGENSTGLYNGEADFRFESNGKLLYIGNITVMSEFISGAEFVAADDNTDEAYSNVTQRYSDPQIKLFGDGKNLTRLDEPVQNGTRDVYYSFNGTSDCGYIYEEIDGKKAVMTSHYKRINSDPKKEFTDGFIYFSLGDAFKSNYRNVKITMDYYDNSTGSIGLFYVNGAATGNFGSTAIRRTGTNTWKTAEFMITNAYFNGAAGTGLGDGKCDFRITGSGEAPVYIHSLKAEMTDKTALEKSFLVKSENADTLYPDGVGFEVTADGWNGNGITFADSSNQQINSSGDGYSVHEEVDGSYAVSTASFGYGNSTGNNTGRMTYLYFDIDDKYLYGLRDSYAKLEIEYHDENNSNIVLHYNKYGAPYQDYIVGTQTGTNTWKTAVVELNAADFVNAQNFGSDFRLTLPTSSTEQAQLKIRKITVKNISHKAQLENDNIPTVYIAGDSIAANYSADSEIIGWGMRLPQYFDGISTVNYAVPGSSTKTFNFSNVAGRVLKNDYVLMSFGHNDSMSDARGVDVETYKSNMEAYITKILDAQAIPVVLSSIPTYKPDGTMSDEIDVYRAAAKEVAKKLNVTFIDLGGQLKAYLSTLDEETALTYYVYENAERRVHLSETGASKAAEIIANSLKEAETVRMLKDYMK